MADDLESLATEPAPPEPAAETEVTTPEVATTSTGDTLLDYIRDTLGEDFSTKFADDDSLLKSLVHAHRLVGRRNEEAEQYQQLRQIIAGREAEFQQFLAGRAAEAKRPIENGEIPDFATVQMWNAQVAANKATPDVQAKLEAFNSQFAKRLYEAAFQRDKAFKDELDRRFQEFEQRLSQGYSAQQQQTALREWGQANKHLLADQSGRDTALGAAVRELYESARVCQRLPENSLERWDAALEIALAQQPRAPKTKPGQKATRQPSVAGNAKTPTMFDFLMQTRKAGKPDAEALEEYVTTYEQPQ